MPTGAGIWLWRSSVERRRDAAREAIERLALAAVVEEERELCEAERDERQRAPLAAPANRDPRVRLLHRRQRARRVAQAVVLPLEARAPLRTQERDHGERLVELLAARREVRARQAELLELGEIRAGAEAQLEAAAADHVERDRHLRKQRRVAKAVAEHELAEPDSLRQRGQRGDERPALEPGDVRRAGWMEVVV